MHAPALPCLACIRRPSCGTHSILNAECGSNSIYQAVRNQADAFLAYDTGKSLLLSLRENEAAHVSICSAACCGKQASVAGPGQRAAAAQQESQRSDHCLSPTRQAPHSGPLLLHLGRPSRTQ